MSEARAKLQRAEKFVEVAELIIDEREPDPDFLSASRNRNGRDLVGKAGKDTWIPL